MHAIDGASAVAAVIHKPVLYILLKAVTCIGVVVRVLDR